MDSVNGVVISNKSAIESDTSIMKGPKKSKEELHPMLSIKDKEITSPTGKLRPLPNPMGRATWFSKYVTFWWMSELLSLGTKRTIEERDLYKLMPPEETERLSDTFCKSWEEEVKQARSYEKKPSLTKALWRTFGPGYASLALLVFLSDGVRIVQPLLLGRLVEYFVEGSTMPSTHAYLYGAGVGLCGFLIVILTSPLAYLRNLYGLRARIACTALVYRKVMLLSSSALASTTTGNIVNLVSVDVEKFQWAAPFIHYLIMGPIQIMIVAWLLWQQIGPAAFAGIGIVICMTPMQIKLGNASMYVRSKALKWMDERVKIMNEIISGMIVIKMYTWEDSFTKWIEKLRKQELKWYFRMTMVSATFTSFVFSSLGLITFATFTTYILTGEALTAARVYTCVSLFNSVRFVMTLNFPSAIMMTNVLLASIVRLAEFLNLDEMRSEGVSIVAKDKDGKCGVIANGVVACWIKDSAAPTLADLSFDIQEGNLLGIIGPVGSGKSSLLMSILGELPLESGTILVQGHVAYVSQQAWVYNCSLRHNILFGKEYDETRYNDVIKACALQKDIELLPNGDLSLVGERGVSLSGGQKARINLARAVYSDADIYLLDDPLSAVDTEVGKHLLERCICGYLRNKARLLVTHQLQFLKEANEIIVLSKGTCSIRGTYNELSISGVDFTALLAKHEDEEDKDREGQHIAPLSDSEDDALGDTKSKVIANKNTQEEDAEIPEETRQTGSLQAKTYLAYIRSFRSLWIGFAAVFFFAFCQAFAMGGDWWLAYWVNAEEKQLKQNSSLTKDSFPHSQSFYLSIYAAFVFGLIIVVLLSMMFYFSQTIIASRNLHSKMLSSIMKTRMHFFDNNSIGRILNRFSKDTTVIDDYLPFITLQVFQNGFICLGILFLVGISNPVTFAVVVPVIFLFIYVRNYFLKSSREMRRIENIKRSPLYGHFSTTLLGLTTIRAYSAQRSFTQQFNAHQDAHTRPNFAFYSAQAWLLCRLQTLSVLFLAFVAVASPALKELEGLNAAMVGLTLSYSILLTFSFQPLVEWSAELENWMTSVERIVEYYNLPHEPPSQTDVKPPDNWPDKGRIEFREMCLSYHEDLPDVLHGISCVIQPKEKIGVVGRTGAGKSSLLSTLFLLAEPKGVIDIDGVNISQLGLKDLRSKLAIIPQDPVLFSGTMRKNLDPLSEHSEAELWQVLQEVQLKDVVQELPEKLDGELSEAGSNFSVGQRQLVCLARAILRRSRILVIDEATANVDHRTDALIQETIREKFKECTVLTIAHRLHTIMDSDRVMVLDSGYLKEFDHPFVLLQNPETTFSALVAKTAEAKRLLEMATQAYHRVTESSEENNTSSTSLETDENVSDERKSADEIEVEIKNPGADGAIEEMIICNAQTEETSL